MFQEVQIQNSCATILNIVRQSGLNFTIQETPYSFYVTVRKTAQKSSHFSNSNLELHIGTLPQNPLTEQLQSRCTFLEQANDHLRHEFANAVDEIEGQRNTIDELQSEKRDLNKQLSESSDNIDIAVETKTKHINDEKRTLQIKHEKICSENKNLKSDLENARKDLNQTAVALKSSKKETKEASDILQKKTGQLETKIKALEEFKKDKMSEEKELKAKLKKVDKKLKAVQEKESKLKLERIVPKKLHDKVAEVENNFYPLNESPSSESE